MKLSAAVLATLFSLQVSAQFSETVEVRVLEIEATVVDRELNAVEGLTRDDFLVTMDGKPAEITNFSFISRGATRDADSAAGEKAVEMPVPTRLIIVIDDLNLHPEPKQRAMAALRRYVEETMDPATTVSLVTWNGMSMLTRTPPTTRRDILMNAINASAMVARFFRRLASFARLILFDKRGTGLSDAVPLSQLPTLEQRMDDVRAVMHAANSTRAVVMGVSEGGTMSSLFAATYPEHTAGVIIFGGYARRLRAPDYPWGPTPEEREMFIEMLEREWGGPVGIEERAPSRAGDPEFKKWWGTYLRMGASPGAAAALTRMNAQIDIRHVLPTIRVPTLVIHRTNDKALRVEEGRYMAERIPGARFLELPGDDHLPFVGDQDTVLAAVKDFISSLGSAAERTRVLATLLFVRTETPDAALDEDAAREIRWFRGDKIGRIHDALVATFDGPARAIRCARALLDAADARGVRLAAGLHTGECELRPDGIAGASVEIGALLAEAAPAGEIIVSNTVRDLVAGSGLEFDPRGQTHLGDRLGEWTLFAVRR